MTVRKHITQAWLGLAPHPSPEHNGVGEVTGITCLPPSTPAELGLCFLFYPQNIPISSHITHLEDDTPRMSWHRWTS